MKSFFKSALKWGSFCLCAYLIGVFLSDLPFESRIGWYLAGLAMAIAYVESSHKDRIADLEYRVDELNRRVRGY